MNTYEIVVFAVMLIEAILRAYPSEKGNSILETIVRALDWLIPDRRKGGGKFVRKTDSTKD